MSTRHQWEQFFDNHAPEYMSNSFTGDTLAEVDFVTAELALPAGSSILDIGCGTGRHSIELAKRGYHMTGIDISDGMLTQARKAAAEAGVSVEFIKGDASRFLMNMEFDGAICLCEGAFSLLSLDDDPMQHDLAILRNVFAMLKPRAQFILTCLNAMRYIRLYSQADVESGVFDPVNMIENSTMDYETPQGKQSLQVRERGYVPTELRLMFHTIGFEVEHIWGGTAGTSKRRAPELDEIELMIIGRKL